MYKMVDEAGNIATSCKWESFSFFVFFFNAWVQMQTADYSSLIMLLH